MDLADEIKGTALSRGATLVGIASADRFEGAPEGHRPWDLLPGATAVIVMALRVPNGVLKSSNLRLYRNVANHLEHELNKLAYEVAMFMEDKGYAASPVAPDIPLDMQQDSGLRGDFSHKHAAVQAGLGWLGTSTLLLTPQFGPRVRLVSVISNVPLKADPKIKEEVCRTCVACVKACPVKAIQENGEIDKLKCLRQCMPYGYGGLYRFIREFMATESEENRRELLRQPKVMELHQFVRAGNYSCANCVKVCPVGKSAEKVST
ncbi:hypothetical protein ACFLYG_02595 [Chloroflexota bacterium]